MKAKNHKTHLVSFCVKERSRNKYLYVRPLNMKYHLIFMYWMLIFNFRLVKIKIEVANEKAAVRDDLAGSI